MKKKNLAAMVGLLGVVGIGGSLAYFNQTLIADNQMSTGKFGSSIVEKFTPDGDWQPGDVTNKDVFVTNTGDVPLVARVKLEEKWFRQDKDGASAGEAYKANDAKVTVEEPSQADPDDGLVEADKSVVKKNMVGGDDWFYDDATGWYYYKVKLEGGKATGQLLDSIQLINDVDLGDQKKTKYYTTMADASLSEDNTTVLGPDGAELEVTGNPATGWAAYEGDMPKDATFNKSEVKNSDDARGYSDSNYVLTITAQTCQATDKAVAAYFSKDTDDAEIVVPREIIRGWNLKSEDVTEEEDKTEGTEATEAPTESPDPTV